MRAFIMSHKLTAAWWLLCLAGAPVILTLREVLP